jgi:hypothetical protein
MVREHYRHVAESLIFGKTLLGHLGKGRQLRNPKGCSERLPATLASVEADQ